MITTEEYCLLWNAITDAVRQLENVKGMLISVQQKAEQIILDKEDYGAIIVFPTDENE